MSGTRLAKDRLLGTCLAATAVVAIAAGAGCGGSNKTSSSSTARIRAVNCCPNGGSATIYINAGSANGSQNFEQSSSYLYIDGGTSSFGYLLSSYQTLSPPDITRVLDAGSNYSIVLIGRADVATSDPRFAKMSLYSDDHGTPPAGDAFVRFINAAPDSAFASATAGATLLASQIPYASPDTYTAVPAGSVSVTVTATGGASVTQTESFNSGSSYTVFLEEPTVPTSLGARPTFGLFVLSDDL